MIYPTTTVIPTTQHFLRYPIDYLHHIDTPHPMARERLYLFTLTQAHRLIDKHLLAIGPISVEIAQDIFRYVLFDGATDFTLVRSRPEPSPRPTDQERGFIKDMRAVCDILELELFDYLLVGTQHCYCCADEEEDTGEMPF